MFIIGSKPEVKRKIFCWKKRTSTDKCLGLAVILFFVVTVSFLFVHLPIFSKDETCSSEACIRSVANILEKMDNSIDPCDDFYQFACGKFMKEAIIPDDNEVKVCQLSILKDKVRRQLREIFQEPIAEDDPKYVKLVKTIFTSCMNTTIVEKYGVAYMKKQFKDLGGWPVLEPDSWVEKTFDWTHLLHRLRKKGWQHNFFFNIYVRGDLTNSSTARLHISHHYPVSEDFRRPSNSTTRQALLKHLVNLVTLMGADRALAEVDMRAVCQFKVNLIERHLLYEERINETVEDNTMTIRDLQREFPSISWLEFINNYLYPSDIVYNLDDVVNVHALKPLHLICNLLKNTRKRVLANTMFLNLLEESEMYLPEAFARETLDYRNKFSEKRFLPTPRWRICYSEATRLDIATSAIYVKELFHNNTKNRIGEMVTDIKESFLDTLQEMDWMDSKTKSQALLKIRNMTSNIAYPDEILDTDYVEDYYDGLDLNMDDYFLQTDFKIKLFNHKKYIEGLRRPLSANDWYFKTRSFSVTSYYDSEKNALDLSAGLLQDVVFDPQRPQYLNYGYIGVFIGREVTRAFNRLEQWWGLESNITYAEKSQCFIDQYNNYTLPDLEVNVNGSETLTANLADNGGVKMAYGGYLKWLARNGPEPALPGLDYTPRQLFWISTANILCGKYRNDNYVKRILARQTPDYFRVLGSLSNTHLFAEDFHCPLGSPMNPVNKCQLW